MQITQYSGSPIVTRESLGEFDFGGFLDKISSTAANIYATKVQSDAQKQAAKVAIAQANAQAQYQNFSPDLLYSGGQYSPIYDGNPATSNIPIVPILMIGGVALAAYFLLRK